MKIAIIQGANLAEVGHREPEIYGETSWQEYQSELDRRYSAELDWYQSDVEGELVQIIKREGQTHDALILNPGAYTHSSVAIADALRMQSVPCVEVHLSQVMAREPYRRRSYIAEICEVSISGAGWYGYDLAIQYLGRDKKIPR